MSNVIKIGEDHRYDLNNSCNAEIKIEPTELTKSTLTCLDVSILKKSAKKLSKLKKALIQTDSEDQTISEENFCKVKIKTEPSELTEPPSKSDPHTWTNDAEDQASIFQSFCESEIKIEPTQLTEYSWLKSSYTQASSKDNQDQTSPIESCNENTNKKEHKPTFTRSITDQALNVDNFDETVKRKGNVSEEEKAEILAYKEAGHNPRYIAKKIGRNLATVYKVFQLQRLQEVASLDNNMDNCDESVKRKGNVSEEEKAEILAYKEAGHNPRYIAKKIGRNLATVYKVFQIQRLQEAASLGKDLNTQILDTQPKYNNGKKRRSPINEKETALILEYKAAGFSIREIAKQIGRAHQNISKHLSRLK